jgi:GxxExxY protein
MVTEKARLNQITETIIGAAIEVHRSLGPGLLESAYEACLAYELGKRGLAVQQQRPLPVVYREIKLDCGYRLDLFVEENVIVEVKAVEHLAPIHDAQLLSYLKLADCRVGLLVNFNVITLKDGVRRLVNHFPQ